MQIKEAVEMFLRYIEIDQGYSQNTIKLYRANLQSFIEAVGNVKVSKINDAKIEAYRESLLKQKISYKTRNLKIIPLRRLFEFLHLKKLMELTPHIEPFRNRNGHDKLVLPEPEQLKKFLAPHGHQMLDTAVFLVYTTGLRLSELLSLKAGEVQEEFNIVGKGAKERFVSAPPTTVTAVRKYEVDAKLKKGAKLFPWHRRTLQQAVTDRAKEDGLENFSIHTLRHCYATFLLSKGKDLRVVQELLGHASVATTQRYTHVTNSQLKDAVKDAFKEL